MARRPAVAVRHGEIVAGIYGNDDVFLHFPNGCDLIRIRAKEGHKVRGIHIHAVTSEAVTQEAGGFRSCSDTIKEYGVFSLCVFHHVLCDISIRKHRGTEVDAIFDVKIGVVSACIQKHSSAFFIRRLGNFRSHNDCVNLFVPLRMLPQQFDQRSFVIFPLLQIRFDAFITPFFEFHFVQYRGNGIVGIKHICSPFN